MFVVGCQISVWYARPLGVMVDACIEHQYCALVWNASKCGPYVHRQQASSSGAMSQLRLRQIPKPYPFGPKVDRAAHGQILFMLNALRPWLLFLRLWSDWSLGVERYPAKVAGYTHVFPFMLAR